MHTTRTLVTVVTVVAVAIVATACGRGGGPDATVPDEETFYLALPEDEPDAASTAEQAVCADGEAYEELKARVEVYNEAVQARIALVKLMIKAAERAGGGEVTRTASRDGFTLTLTAVDDGAGTVSYTVTLTDPDGEVANLLTGTSDADLSEGAWDFQGLAANRAVHVAWTNVDGVLTVDRTATGDFGERTSHYVRTATDVDVTFVGPAHDATAHWNRDTKDGSITIDGNETCWDGTDDAFCSVDCA